MLILKNKILFLLFFSLSIVFSYSQENLLENTFTKREIKNLKSLNISFNNYSFDDKSFNKDLKELVYFNRKRKQNKVWAYTLSGAGVLLLVATVAIVSNKSVEDIHSYSTLTAFSSAMYFGASIPFFIGTHKNKKRMKKKLIFVEEKLQ